MEKRGWLRDPKGKWIPVPHGFVGDDVIPYPFELPEKKAGESVQLLRPSDWYMRHELVKGQTYVYLRRGVKLDEVPRAEIDALLSQ